MDIKAVHCPLTDTEIDNYQCYLYCEAAEGNIPENEMPLFKSFEEESKICNKCKYHSID
ncbi:MAG: hypothetical protein IJG06_01120 [Clostridia bacterium]|nr:hypothetical protein [Clostridia bacterium]MBQ9599258.1 hypothetical protein [Clostridia bacterium]MBR0027983.1 hypothetical protein [Clostridia bacterium]